MQKPTRHQLAFQLLKEEPHLKFGTAAFRQAFILRAICVVGADMRTLASYTGYSKIYVRRVLRQNGDVAMKALRAFSGGQDKAETTEEQARKFLSKVLGSSVARLLAKAKKGRTDDAG